MAKVALITGASKGIGRAIALRLAREGLDVVVNFQKDRKGAEAVVQIVRDLGRTAIAVQADVSVAAEVQRLFGRADELGGPQVLINNAGVYQRTTLDELDLARWSRTLKINLTGAFLCARLALPPMRAAGWGRIVNVASQLALRGTEHGADYAAAKAGLLGLTKCLALELAPHNITVNAVSPGTIETSIIGHYTEADRDQRRRTIPLGRIGTPEEVAAAVAFLASDDAKYITGANLLVTGGGLIL